MLDEFVAVLSAIPLAFYTNMQGELVLNSGKAFRRESIDRDARIELEQYLDSSTIAGIMTEVVFMDVIQKGNRQ
jgi:hypothetical protein